MDLTRRGFLAAAAATAAVGTGPAAATVEATGDAGAAADADLARLTLFGTAQDGAGTDGIMVADVAGGQHLAATLPGRGHGVAVSPDGSLAAVTARRPGTFAAAFRPATGEVVARFATPADRHFQGHGAFSRDGRLFLATENAFEIGEGRIGLYDATAGFARVGELPCYGVGPHEMVRVDGRDALVVAVGGIRTHPATGRSGLNTDVMRPLVAVVDASSGERLAEHRAPAELHQLSLRHLAVRRDGYTAVVGRWEGHPLERPPLILAGSLQAGLRPVALPDEAVERLANYTGAVCFDGGGRYMAVSAPRGNVCAVLAVDGEGTPVLRRMLEIPDVCGLAPGPGEGEVFLTSGRGQLYLYRAEEDRLEELSGPSAQLSHWDNHITTWAAEPAAG
ncbi:MAG: DUF1513 domain-containing protein [Rhodospirillaceae bacterium]|nr:DUF1513 domain-containing protein [Rhodospirillaceae bacterium]